MDDYEFEMQGQEDKDGLYTKWKEDWEGHYFSNNYQLVTEEDALNWRRALERAMDDHRFLRLKDRPPTRKIREFMDFLADGEFRIG